MSEMTTFERMTCVFAHREPDRVPVVDWFWESTVARWCKEGLPPDSDVSPYFGDVSRHFGLEDMPIIGVDASPRFEPRLIEETDSYRIDRDAWGLTKKNFKPCSSTPMFVDCAVKDPASWQRAKKRMTPARDRVDWAALEREYKRWRERGAWVAVAPWYGFDVVSTRMCESELILTAMADSPDWVADMCNTGCELALALLDMVWHAGYTFDEFLMFDDMAYRNGMLFSKRMWHEIIRPYQKRAIDWAHAHGVKAHLHCCGNITALVPELIEVGFDALNPLERKAGMDPLAIKKAFGERLVLRGGFDVRDWTDWPKVERDIRTLLPGLMKSGGYIFSSDHSVPDDVSLETYGRIVELVKDIGTY